MTLVRRILTGLVILILFLVVLMSVNVFSSADQPRAGLVFDVNRLKTGDIIASSDNTATSVMISGFTNSIWAHTGVIYRDPLTNETYILETINYPGSKKHTPLRTPLSEWLRYNKKRTNAVVELILTNGAQVDTTALNLAFEGFAGTKIDFFNTGWKRFLSTRTYKEEVQKRYTCFEMTIQMLQKTGVFKKELAHSSYFPCDVVRGHVPTEKGFAYKAPRFLDLNSYAKALKAG